MKTRNWKPHKSDQVFIAHDPALCEGRPCCVHNPSDHHMRDWPQHYRTDTKVTERICPHGVGHPDPDQTWPKDDHHWVHGCDGCCMPPDSEQDEEQRWCYADCVSYTLEELGDAAWQTGCPRCGDNCLAEASPVDLELYEAYHQ